MMKRSQSDRTAAESCEAKEQARTVTWPKRIVAAVTMLLFSLGVSAAEGFAAADGVEITQEHLGSIEFIAYRQASPDSFFAEVFAQVPDATQVRMRKGDGDWIVFDQDSFFVDEFFVESDAFLTLGQLNSELAGDWTLDVTYESSVSTYTYTMRELVLADFPPVPVLADVPATVSESHIFTWTWSGTADVRYIDIEGQDDLFWQDGDAGFADLSHEHDFGVFTGPGSFVIGYGNELADLVSDWTSASGEDVFGADVAQHSASQDTETFTVVSADTGDFTDIVLLRIREPNGGYSVEMETRAPENRVVKVTVPTDPTTTYTFELDELDTDGYAWYDFEQGLDGDPTYTTAEELLADFPDGNYVFAIYDITGTTLEGTYAVSMTMTGDFSFPASSPQLTNPVPIGDTVTTEPGTTTYVWDPYSGPVGTATHTGFAIYTVPDDTEAHRSLLAIATNQQAVTLDAGTYEMELSHFNVAVNQQGGVDSPRIFAGNEALSFYGLTVAEPGPTLSVASAQVAEDGGQLTVTISLSQPADNLVTVNVATADGTATAPDDYLSVSTQVTFAPGFTSQQISVTIVDDGLAEGNEVFTVNLSGASGAPIASGAATVTIIDNDVPTVSVSGASAMEGNPLSFTLSLDVPSPVETSVNYATANGTATAGSDYVASSGTVTFAPNQMTATVVVQSNDDALSEEAETFTLTLSNPTLLSLGNAVGTGTIEDNDLPFLSLSLAVPSISEGGGTTVGTVTRNTDTGTELVVDLISSDTSEAVVPATVTIAQGSSTGTFTVMGVDDDEFDGDVLVTITASSLDHADGTVTITIFDDEQTENLIYAFTIRGTRYGDGVVNLAGTGYLVVDMLHHRASALVRWQDNSGDRIDFPSVYVTDIGASNLWVIHLSDIEPEPRSVNEYSYAHMIGTEYPIHVPLGGGVTGPAVVSFDGPWRGGLPNNDPTIVEMGNMSARFDYARTRQENGSNTLFEDLLAELAEEGNIDLGEQDGAPEVTVAPLLSGQGVACYNLTWSGVDAGEDAVQNFSYPGYLLLDLATGDVQVLLAWRQDNQWHYTVESWSEGDSFAYPLTVGNSTYTFLGGRKEQVAVGQTHPDSNLFRFMYGANRTVRIGLPSNEPQSLPMSFSGNIWGHQNLDVEANIYTQSSISCGINAMTLHMNQELMTINQAMTFLEGTLTGFIRD